MQYSFEARRALRVEASRIVDRVGRGLSSEFPGVLAGYGSQGCHREAR
jgi:hypothetical protein